MNSKHVTIIAEAGVNHNGSIILAKQLIDVAKDAGADIIKFQTFKSESLVTKDATQAEYQARNTGNETMFQYDMLKKLELSHEDHLELKRYCEKKGIKFWSTAFDIESVDYLNSLHLGLWKIPSGEITNYPYIRKIASFNESIIMSTGMCEIIDIENALNALKENGQDLSKVILLHCNTEYPTPMEDVNLNSMKTIGEKFNLPIGYSDHTIGIEVPIAAVALGATVIEKHITLNRNMAGPDHKASLEPHELKAMVTAIRNIEKALGHKEKTVTESECKNISVARKSIVAAKKISQGDFFTEDNITTKRPGTGISPMKWHEVIGKQAVRKFDKDEIIEI